MDSETFTYWLQGFVELSDSDSISEKQWLMIKDHLKLVFDKKTPDRNGIEYRDNMPTWPPKDGLPSLDELLGRPKPVDLVGKQFDSTFWVNNPPALTC